MTIVEVLTQRLPIWEWTGHADPPAPRTLPAPFLEIVRNCLRRDPAMRCKVREISENLEPESALPVASARSVSTDPVPSLKSASYGAASSQPMPATIPPPHKSNSRYAVQAFAFVLALAAVIAIPRYFRHSAKSNESEPVAAAPDTLKTATPQIEVASQPATPTTRVTQPATEPVTQPSTRPMTRPAAQPAPPKPERASKPVTHASEPRVNAADPVSPAPRKPAPAVAAPSNPRPVVNSPASVPARGKVVHQVMPDVSQGARNTIRGKVRVSVKVNVDPSGKVTDAAFEAPGPSKYFADAAIRAAKNWTFAPAKANGENVASQWLLRFEFAPAGTETFSAEINP